MGWWFKSQDVIQDLSGSARRQIRFHGRVPVASLRSLTVGPYDDFFVTRHKTCSHFWKRKKGRQSLSLKFYPMNHPVLEQPVRFRLLNITSGFSSSHTLILRPDQHMFYAQMCCLAHWFFFYSVINRLVALLEAVFPHNTLAKSFFNLRVFIKE